MTATSVTAITSCTTTPVPLSAPILPLPLPLPLSRDLIMIVFEYARRTSRVIVGGPEMMSFITITIAPTSSTTTLATAAHVHDENGNDDDAPISVSYNNTNNNSSSSSSSNNKMGQRAALSVPSALVAAELTYSSASRATCTAIVNDDNNNGTKPSSIHVRVGGMATIGNYLYLLAGGEPAMRRFHLLTGDMILSTRANPSPDLALFNDRHSYGLCGTYSFNAYNDDQLFLAGTLCIVYSLAFHMFKCMGLLHGL